MPPETGTALLILVAFVLPGFATLLIKERIYEIPGEPSQFERLLSALFYSVLVYVAVGIGLELAHISPDELRAHAEDASFGEFIAAAVATIFVLPAAIAYCGARWSASRLRKWTLRRLKISLSHRTRNAWDHFFRQEIQAYVRVSLRDGRIVGGYFGPGSAAGYGHQEGDLFVRELWELDEEGWFDRPMKRSLGSWIPREEVILLEVYAVSDEQEAELFTRWEASAS